MPNNKREQISFADKIFELKGLFIFIMCAAVASVVIMNLLVLPVSVFAITHKHAFTFAVKIFFLLLLLSYLIVKIRRHILTAKNRDVSALHTVSAAAGRKFRKLGYFLTSALLALAVVLLMYYVLTANSQIIYEMMK
jgi:hypothetical protein